MTISALYAGTVVHRRLRPLRHHLRYGVFYLLLDLDELPALSRRLRLFSLDRFNLFAFHQRDHGDRRPGGLRAWVERHLTEAGLAAAAGGPIRVLCMPRILGHAFNPISVFFCHRPDGSLLAMLYEVRNTFGERHSYLIPAAQPDGELRQSCEKRFFVSPFMPMRLTYRFRVRPPGAAISLGITAADEQGVLIATAFGGRREPLTDATLLRRFLRMPLQGAKVLGAIHWEALKLWLRGLRLHARPRPPASPVSHFT